MPFWKNMFLQTLNNIANILCMSVFMDKLAIHVISLISLPPF